MGSRALRATQMLAEEGAASAANEAAREQLRAEKIRAKEDAAAARLDDEDPCLALCSTRFLGPELRECFDALGALKPRHLHHAQMDAERDAMIALGVFPGSLVAAAAAAA